VAGDDHTEAGAVHLVGGEAERVSLGFGQQCALMRDGLGRIEDDDAAAGVGVAYEVGEVGEQTSVDVRGHVDDHDRAFELGRLVDQGAIGGTVEHQAGQAESGGGRHSGQEDRVVLDMARDHLREPIPRQLLQQQVEAEGRVEGEGDRVTPAGEAEQLEHGPAGVLHLPVDAGAPGVFHAPAAGVVLRVVLGQGVEDRLRPEALTGGVEVDRAGFEVSEIGETAGFDRNRWRAPEQPSVLHVLQFFPAHSRRAAGSARRGWEPAGSVVVIASSVAPG